MAVADIMDDIDYKTINFNVEEAEFRHPLWMTESHFVYNLYICVFGGVCYEGFPFITKQTF
jgi:hypothetical protein